MTYDIRLMVYRYYQYIDHPLFFIQMPTLCNDRPQIVTILQRLDEWYGNTAQDTTEWALEYQLWARMLFSGYVMLNPMYLDLDDVMPEFLDALCTRHSGTDHTTLYQEAFNYVKEHRMIVGPDDEYIEISIPVDAER